jgi:sRNA-binding regulator protein Hfq
MYVLRYTLRHLGYTVFLSNGLTIATEVNSLDGKVVNLTSMEWQGCIGKFANSQGLKSFNRDDQKYSRLR